MILIVRVNWVDTDSIQNTLSFCYWPEFCIATQPPDSFTIQLSTTPSAPKFPNFPGFPFGKRGVISADEQLDDKENDNKKEWNQVTRKYNRDI